ncbi:MAG: sucrase ferredoxin [Coleofasciculus sp. B1-GNL1-01]|uniref:sucrase ferredoxin n=1 Tax=Coleofasciculus sp. B1-GNL1-01 TaxID=3068484 RepID=UPI0032F0BDAC
MEPFFCSHESRQAGEEPIGMAGDEHLYVLIECPPPWAAMALTSQSIPANLRQLKEEIEQAELSVRFLLIHSHRLKQENYTRVLIFRKPEGLATTYERQELQVSDLQEVAPAVKDCLVNWERRSKNTQPQTRDILVCTHGTHDKCCAKYGKPFYYQALATVEQLSLDQVRIWECSHFGGHRFAPTIIDFPESRYYARLDATSLTSVLTKTGDINCFKDIYRGWSLLPYLAQVLERELIFRYGWEWFDYSVNCQIIEQNEEETFSRIELIFKTPDGVLKGYRADVVEDENKCLYLIGDCEGNQAEKTPQFQVQNLIEIEPLSVGV